MVLRLKAERQAAVVPRGRVAKVEAQGRLAVVAAWEARAAKMAKEAKEAKE